MLQIRILCIALKKRRDLSSFYGHETINGEQFCQFNILLSRISFSINLYHRREKIVKWLKFRILPHLTIDVMSF